MVSVSKERIVELLAGPHQAVLSVSRSERGSVAVPMSYTYDGDRLFFVTSPASLHGRLVGLAGRATLTIQFEEVDRTSVEQWYVMAEGPVTYTDADPAPYVRAILIKDRGEENVESWRANEPDPEVKVAELVPDGTSGYELHASRGALTEADGELHDVEPSRH